MTVSNAAALADRLAAADTPLQAWAGIVLAQSSHAGLRKRGQEGLTLLADSMVDVDALVHADVATYALVRGAGYLSGERQKGLIEAIPPLGDTRSTRARFYDSNLYVYLLCRGFGREHPLIGQDVSGFIDQALRDLCDRPAANTTDLVLLVAAHFELGRELTDEVSRKVQGQLSTRALMLDEADALRWLVELYSDRWSPGAAQTELREALRRAASQAAAPVHVDSTSLVLTAMQLELASMRSPQYQLITHDEVQKIVSARAGARPRSEAIAYSILLLLLSVLPMYFAHRAGWFDRVIGVAGALALVLPSLTFVYLLIFRGSNGGGWLLTSFLIGVAYWLLALVAGGLRLEEMLNLLRGENALVALALETIVLVSSVIIAVRSRRT